MLANLPSLTVIAIFIVIGVVLGFVLAAVLDFLLSRAKTSPHLRKQGSLESLLISCTEHQLTENSEKISDDVRDLHNEWKSMLTCEGPQQYIKQKIQKLQDLLIETADGELVTADEIFPRVTNLGFLGEAQHGIRRRPRFVAVAPATHSSSVKLSLRGFCIVEQDWNPELLGKFFRCGWFIDAKVILLGLLLGVAVAAISGAILDAFSLEWFRIVISVIAALLPALIINSLFREFWEGLPKIGLTLCLLSLACGGASLAWTEQPNADHIAATLLWTGIAVGIVPAVHYWSEESSNDGAVGCFLWVITGLITAINGLANLLILKGFDLASDFVFGTEGYLAASYRGAAFGALTGLIVCGLRVLLDRKERTLILETSFPYIVPESIRQIVPYLQRQFDDVLLIGEAGRWQKNYSPPLEPPPPANFFVIVRKGDLWWLAATHIITQKALKDSTHTLSEL